MENKTEEQEETKDIKGKDGMRGWVVSRFSKEREMNVLQRGEMDVHSNDAVEQVNKLTCLPTEIVDAPTPDGGHSQPQPVEDSPDEIAPPPEGKARILLCMITRGIMPDMKQFESFLKFWQEMIRLNNLHNKPSIPDMQNTNFSWAALLSTVQAEAN